jgi:hypothetical protein
VAYNTEVLADSPLLYWQLDDTSGASVVDASPNGRNGAVSGTWNFQQAPHVNTSTCGLTSGGGALVSPTIAFGAADITVEMWAYVDTSQTYMLASFGVIYLDLFVNAGRVGVNTGAGDQYGCALTSGYHHIVALMPNAKATTNAVIYVDGVLQTLSGASGTAPSIASTTFQVSGWSANGSYRIPNGHYVDEVAIYSGALSGARILAHYNAGVMPSNAQVETVYAETLVLGTPQAQVETVYIESLVLGSPKGQVETMYVEMLVPALMNRRIGWGLHR